MTDIHSHLIYDVDDGSKSLEESIELIKRLNEVGFNNIIMTPHYIEGSEYCALNPEKLEKLEVLRNAVKEKNISVGNTGSFKPRIFDRVEFIEKRVLPDVL